MNERNIRKKSRCKIGAGTKRRVPADSAAERERIAAHILGVAPRKDMLEEKLVSRSLRMKR